MSAAAWTRQLESTVRYFGIEANNALARLEQTEISNRLSTAGFGAVGIVFVANECPQSQLFTCNRNVRRWR
jgi:hypothetical protein